MQAEKAVVKLTNNALGTEEVIEQPALPERIYIRVEDRSRIRAETARLVHSEQNIFEPKRLQLEIPWVARMAEFSWIENVIGVPVNILAIYAVIASVQYAFDENGRAIPNTPRTPLTTASLTRPLPSSHLHKESVTSIESTLRSNMV